MSKLLRTIQFPVTYINPDSGLVISFTGNCSGTVITGGTSPFKKGFTSCHFPNMAYVKKYWNPYNKKRIIMAKIGEFREN